MTAHYAPAAPSERALREAVRDCGYHCRGEMLPDHQFRFAEPGPHAAHARHAAQPGAMDDVAPDMGHGAGMDMAGMVRGMRNRCIV